MADVAELGLQVNADPAIASVQRYDRALGELDKSGTKVERGQATLEESMKKAARSTDTAAKTTGLAGANFDKLNIRILQLADRATKSVPPLNAMIRGMSGFAVGSTVMAGALLGLGALALAFRKITEDAREARAKLEEHIAVLTRVAEARRVAEAGGPTRDSLGPNQAEAQRVAALLDNAIKLGNEALVTSYGEQLRTLNNIIRAAIGDLADEEAEAARKRSEQNARELAEINRIIAALNRKAQAADPVNASDPLRSVGAVGSVIDFQFIPDQKAAILEVSAFVIDTLNAKHRLRKQLEEDFTDEAIRQAETRAAAEEDRMRRIYAAARGLDILGGAIGGRTGGAIQGAAGAGLTAAAFTGNPFIIGGAAVLGFAKGLFGANKEAERAAEAARETARLLREQAQALRDDLRARVLRATGDVAGADLASLDARQRRERQESRNLDPSTRALLEVAHSIEREALIRNQRAQEQIRLAEDQIDLLDDQIREQERSVETLRTLTENLDAFSDSLRISSLSPLSPAQKLEEARAQFEALRTLALGGDVTAAASLPEAARSLLEASRGFNASGEGFVSDFNRVQATIDRVRDRFGEQLSIEEQMLEELRAARQLQQDEIDAIREQTDDANARAREAYEQRERIEASRNGGGAGKDPPGDNGEDDADDVLRAMNTGIGFVVLELKALNAQQAALASDLVALRQEQLV